MVWGAITAKAKCNVCDDVITATSNTEFVECSCGSTRVKGIDTFKIIEGSDYKDLTDVNFDNVPPHKES